MGAQTPSGSILGITSRSSDRAGPGLGEGTGAAPGSIREWQAGNSMECTGWGGGCSGRLDPFPGIPEISSWLWFPWALPDDIWRVTAPKCRGLEVAQSQAVLRSRAVLPIPKAAPEPALPWTPLATKAVPKVTPRDRGALLFHDIHCRAGDKLLSQGLCFEGSWNHRRKGSVRRHCPEPSDSSVWLPRHQFPKCWMQSLPLPQGSVPPHHPGGAG